MDWVSLTTKERDEIVRQNMKNGEDDFIAGKRLADNPHGPYAPQHAWWRRGYQNAAFSKIVSCA